MTPERLEVVSFLRAEMVQRQERNPSYSLRAFARDLSTSPAILSLVLQGKRALTTDKAIGWADGLRLSQESRNKFLKAVTRDQEVRHDPTQRKTRALEEKMAYVRLQHDEFALISDWWHFGLMNLPKLKDYQSDVRWMAKKLGISEEQCAEALLRLERLGLMSKSNGRWERTDRPVETTSDLPSEAIRSFHRQNIRRALASIDEVAVDERDISSIMMTVKKANLPEAKRRIRLFRKELAAFLGEPEGDEVYSLNMQLFPQTSSRDNK